MVDERDVRSDVPRPLTAKRAALAALGVTLLVVQHLREVTPRDVADAIWPERVKRRREATQAELSQGAAKYKADRLYKAAMSQASQPADDPMDRARLSWLALESFRQAEQVLWAADVDPGTHPRRLPAVRRLEERGGRGPDGCQARPRTNPHDVLEAMVEELWDYNDMPTDREARAMIGLRQGEEYPWRAGTRRRLGAQRAG